jgi:hypothetical protein
LLSRREDNPEAPVELKKVEDVFIRVAPVIQIGVRGYAVAENGSVWP